MSERSRTRRTRRRSRRMWRALSEFDWETLKSCMHPEIHYTGRSDRRPRRARAGQRGQAAEHRVGSPGEAGAGAASHRVRRRRRLPGPHREMDLQERRGQVEHTFATMHEMKDGKVYRWSDYWDVQKFVGQFPPVVPRRDGQGERGRLQQLRSTVDVRLRRPRPDRCAARRARAGSRAARAPRTLRTRSSATCAATPSIAAPAAAQACAGDRTQLPRRLGLRRGRCSRVRSCFLDHAGLSRCGGAALRQRADPADRGLQQHHLAAALSRRATGTPTSRPSGASSATSVPDLAAQCVMGHSRLFEAERIRIATAVAWFYDRRRRRLRVLAATDRTRRRSCTRVEIFEHRDRRRQRLHVPPRAAGGRARGRLSGRTHTRLAARARRGRCVAHRRVGPRGRGDAISRTCA